MQCWPHLNGTPHRGYETSAFSPIFLYRKPVSSAMPTRFSFCRDADKLNDGISRYWFSHSLIKTQEVAVTHVSSSSTRGATESRKKTGGQTPLNFVVLVEKSDGWVCGTKGTSSARDFSVSPRWSFFSQSKIQLGTLEGPRVLTSELSLLFPRSRLRNVDEERFVFDYGNVTCHPLQ